MLRELLFNGADREALKKSSSKPSIVDSLPVSKNGDATWMSKVVEHLSVNDLAIASAGQAERIFRVQRLECDGNEYFAGSSPFFATVSSEVAFLIPNGGDMLTLFSVPVSKNMSLNQQALDPELSTILEIRYPGVEGDRFINGAKGAINSLAITFDDQDAVKTFIQMVEERQHENIRDRVLGAPGTPRKHSIAFMEFDSASVDDNRGKGTRSNSTAKIDADPSSPLHNISSRKRHKQDSTATSTLQIHASTVQLAERSSNELSKGASGPKLSLEDESLIGLPHTSQSSHKRVRLRARMTSGRVQLGHRNMEVDVAEGAEGAEDAIEKEPASQSPSDGVDLDLSHDPDRSFTTSGISKPRHDTEPANKSSPVSGNECQSIIVVDFARKTPRQKIAMAKVVVPQPDAQSDSQAEGGPAKMGLKRRTVKDATALQNEQMQKPLEATSEAADFDLPPSSDEEIRPIKKAKTKTSKTPTKSPLKDSTSMKKGTVQIAVSPKRHKKKQIEKKMIKPAGQKSQRTAASTRSRRAAKKTPTYIEEADESYEDTTEEEVEEKEREKHETHDKAAEAVRGSLPLSKGATKTGLKASQRGFASDMQEILDGDSIDREDDREDGLARGPLACCPPDEQLTSMHGSVARQPSPEQAVASNEKHTSKHSGENAVSKTIPGSKGNDQQKSTYQGDSKRLSESSIPPVSEKLLRKTKIVHFGPQGPGNQAVPIKSPVTLSDCESIKEISPAPKRVRVRQDELVEDIDELVPDYCDESSPSPPEIEETRILFAHDGDDIPKEPGESQGLDVHAHADNMGEQIVSASDEQTCIINEPETSRHVISRTEKTASGNASQLSSPPRSHKTGVHQTRLQRPFLANDASHYYASRAKGTQITGESITQSIKTNSASHQGYTQTRKPVGNSKNHAGHQTPATKESSTRSAVSHALRSTSEEIIQSENPEPTRELNNTGLSRRVSAVPKIHRDIVSLTQDNPVTGPHGMRDSCALLPHIAPDSMAPPPPPADSVKQPSSLRRIRPAAQARQTALPLKAMSQPVITGPIRVKKSTSLPLVIEPELEPELPPATPDSFSTRLHLHDRFSINEVPDNGGPNTTGVDTWQNVGNDSLTFVNGDETVYGDRLGRGLKRGRRQQSDSEHDGSMTASPSNKPGGDSRRGDSMMAFPSARESQRGMLDAIINITNDVLFRFGAEEDAIRSKVSGYDRGGGVIIQTLTDTWTQRLEHERHLLEDILKEEKEVLTTALQLVQCTDQLGGNWRETIYNQELTRKVQDKGDGLAQKIENLKKRG
ncbi:hypothetical protein AYO20_08818 [Fonsecaea nubica]|uniref:Uncharacterized protein n=1 Tax=Fonsecaea nubica TaxID=856822 RepID=A0A178CLH8_9EURO|nr:hypothetical protein AYO20_08818 [Fonsecaea nubica]OAL30244.1 hypothetical protein AYO20_08818 [Fonsecaea nubica]